MKERIDVLLVEQGFFPSRERARTALMEGIVFVDGNRVDKAGTKVDAGSEIIVKGDELPYVSRGGLKLEKAVSAFDIDLSGLTCIDIGASTGGFTDCMLQNGAAKVYAVDVGYGQLDWKLRCDERVVNIERCNARYLKFDEIGEKADFISCDVSFISLSHIFPVIKELLKDEGHAVTLIKPQFEAGKAEVDRGKGVIKDQAIHEKVILDVIRNASLSGLNFEGLDYSPIKGPKGNIEFLLFLAKVENKAYNTDRVLKIVQNTVKVSHEGSENH